MSSFDAFLTGVANAAAGAAGVLPDVRIEHWTDIVSYRPPADVQLAFANRASGPTPPDEYPQFHFNQIEDGYGHVNLDEYRVDIARPFTADDLPDLPPTTFGPELFAHYLRVGFGPLLGVALHQRNPHSIVFNFDPEEDGVDDVKWKSPEPNNAIGAVMRFLVSFKQLPVGDWAPVLAGSCDSLSWIFTSVHTPNGADHPVSGNRHFGIEPHDDGSFTFFNKGADRATGLLDVPLYLQWLPIGLSMQREIWEALQQAVADFVTSHNGEARVTEPVRFLKDWDLVKDIAYHPTENWVV